ncbi:Cytochrome P450 2B19 [Heterocephalus glaber]|uniref:Cytochrome P450 n=1 Tax=Heterocephalus glaber TaxID=10181 RepID=G5BR62_HETGA|nr:Cytochrome P450 2B19 [Heterocephalus glaber]
MELSVLLLLTLLMGLLVLLFRGHPKTHGHLPPGPRPLPFLGNLLQMNRKGLVKSILQKSVVMLCGPETIREALVDQAEAFSGRGTIASTEAIFQGYGLNFANGERWNVLRRFTLATMRDFGMGKWSMEERIQEEAQCLVEELRKSQGGLVDPLFLFQSATANIICSTVFGKRFDYKDRQFLRLLDLIYQSFALISSFSSQMFELFPSILKHFPGTHREISKVSQEIITFIGHSVEKHQETLDPSAPRDFIDAYLLRMEKDKSDPHTEFHHKNLVLTSLSLFFAGTETTSTTLRYGFLFLLKYPHVAERVHKEIEQVIGSHRQRALDDRTKMPYTEAVICEIQRFADLVPIGLPHVVTKDIHFRGFIIPKMSLAGLPHLCNTEIFPILTTALHDPRHFEKPDTFNPDHFLDAKEALKKSEAFMPFSIGKCICLGEGIARAELFLFFTTILQNFSISSPVAPEDIDLTPQKIGVGRIPPSYQIRFLPHVVE